MKKLIHLIVSIMLVAAALAVAPVQVARADSAVVGTGTPASCTEAALDAALAELFPGATAPGGLLSFDCGPNPHTIVVTSEKFLQDGSVIDGGGLITLSGGNSTRVFFVSQQARVELRHLQLINGYAAGGGAIFVEPNFSGDYTYLTLNDVTLRDNNSTSFGGAIDARHASLSVTNSHLTGNSSDSDGGAISLNEGVLTMINSEVLNNRTISPGANGGGLDVLSATLDIQTTTFRNNQSQLSAGGAITLRLCNGTIANSLMDQNTAANIGGGIYQQSGNVTLSQVTFTNNTAPSGGGIANDNGALVLNGATTMSGNTATNNGGGIFNFNGQLAAQNVQLLNNQAAYGGGLYNSLNGTLTLADVTLSGNSATSGGGGMYNSGQSTLTRVTLALNTAGDGGAAFNTDTANLTLTNSTLSENQANFGGGVFNNGTLSLTNVTIAKNLAGGGGGGLLHNSGAASHLAMVNTLFSANTASSAANDQCLLYENPESQLFSLWQGVSCGSSTANGNQPNTIAPLAPLGFTGTGLPSELTMTHVPLPGSPAEDAGTCNNGAPSLDQRGVARPSGAACDIGAVEMLPTIPAPTITSLTPNSGPAAGGTTVAIAGANLTGGTVTFGGLPGVSCVVNSATQLTCATPAHATGAVDVIVTTPDGSATSVAGFTYATTTLTISGNAAGVGGVTLTYVDGGIKTVTSVANGTYSISVPAGWSGSVTPSKPGYADFYIPVSRTFANIAANQTAQNFGAQVTFKSVGTYDGWVLETGYKTSKGGTFNALETTFKIGDDAKNRRYAGILSFDTTSLPDVPVLWQTSALKLKTNGYVGIAPFPSTTGGYKIVFGMNKGPLGALALQAADFQTKLTRSLSGRFLTKPVNSWYSGPILGKDISPAVNVLGPTQLRVSVSVLIGTPPAILRNFKADYIRFYSGNSGLANRPALVVKYLMP